MANEARADPAPVVQSGRWRPRLGFLRHFGEMFLVMMLGMMLLGMPYRAIVAAMGYTNPNQQLPELTALLMTVDMTLPMVLWMRYRGDGWERTTEMAGAMVVPAVVIVGLCVLGMIPERNLSGVVMMPMLPAMLAVMLFRRADYTHPGVHQPGVQGPRRPRPV